MYETKFMQLLRFATDAYPTEKKKVKKFVYGLREGLRTKVMGTKPATFAEAVEQASLNEISIGARRLRRRSPVESRLRTSLRLRGLGLILAKARIAVRRTLALRLNSKRALNLNRGDLDDKGSASRDASSSNHRRRAVLENAVHVASLTPTSHATQLIVFVLDVRSEVILPGIAQTRRPNWKWMIPRRRCRHFFMRFLPVMLRRTR